MPRHNQTFVDEGEFSVPIQLNPGQNKIFYLKIRNGFLGNPRLVFWLMGTEKFIKTFNREKINFWQGIFHGILWVMIVYNIFFAILGRDKTYLYYALYMISISIYFFNIVGYFEKLIFPENPELTFYIALIMQVAIIFYLLFIRKFLNLKKILPKWDRMIDYLIIASVVLLSIKSIYFLSFHRYGIFMYISQIAVILGALLTIGLIVALYRSKSILARYFMFGSIALGAGLAVSSFMSFSPEAFSPAYFSSIQLGIVFEILFFSIGLSYKMSETERDKNLTHQELIKQLKEKELLQKNYTSELEREVDDRTHEILEKKKELEKQTVELESLNEEKNHLIGIVAHDLRNPLTSALSMITYLSNEPGSMNEEQIESAKILSSSLERMNSMVDKILDIKAIESKKLNIDLRKTELSVLVDHILSEFDESARRKSIIINKRLEPVNIIADTSYISQVFENLISNAIKFSPLHKKINIAVFSSDGKAKFEISDEGPGFTEEDKRKLFRKYQRLSAMPTAGESSTGLGLSIVKKFVEMHNGKIFVNSEQGHGARFILEFDLINS
jgi:signal transduction histidine kinase